MGIQKYLDNIRKMPDKTYNEVGNKIIAHCILLAAVSQSLGKAKEVHN